VKEAANLRPDHTKLPPVDWEELENWITARLEEAKREKK
jgi:hypothetical protein